MCAPEWALRPPAVGGPRGGHQLRKRLTGVQPTRAAHGSPAGLLTGRPHPVPRLGHLEQPDRRPLRSQVHTGLFLWGTPVVVVMKWRFWNSQVGSRSPPPGEPRGCLVGLPSGRAGRSARESFRPLGERARAAMGLAQARQPVGDPRPAPLPASCSVPRGPRPLGRCPVGVWPGSPVLWRTRVPGTLGVQSFRLLVALAGVRVLPGAVTAADPGAAEPSARRSTGAPEGGLCCRMRPDVIRAAVFQACGGGQGRAMPGFLLSRRRA